MSTRGKLKQYLIVLETLNAYPSDNKRILEKLEDGGFSISKRTLTRVIDDMRNEFDFDIVHNFKTGKYHIANDPSDTRVHTLIRLLQLDQMGDFLSDMLKNKKKQLQWVAAESSEQLKGVEQLPTLFAAIKEHKQIKFTHENLKHDTSYSFTVHPYMLKEYLNRWYLVATSPNNDTPFIYGVDRISQLETINEYFEPNPKFPYNELFNHVIGINYSNFDIETVRLEVPDLQYKYLEKLPLHATQKLISRNEHHAIIELRVILNFELTQSILMLGERVKVLAPISLVNEVKEKLLAALKNYQ